MLDDAVQNVVRECTRCQLVVLCRFYDVLVMPDDSNFFSMASVTLEENQTFASRRSAKSLFVCYSFSSTWWRCFSWRWTMSRMRLVFSLRVLISSFNWVILTVLKVDMAMAAIEICDESFWPAWL